MIMHLHLMIQMKETIALQNKWGKLWCTLSAVYVYYYNQSVTYMTYKLMNRKTRKFCDGLRLESTLTMIWWLCLWVKILNLELLDMTKLYNWVPSPLPSKKRKKTSQLGMTRFTSIVPFSPGLGGKLGIHFTLDYSWNLRIL